MIIVFGSINIDLVARVGRLPRAGETVLGPGYDVIPGGKGANQALAARRAGSDVVMVGAVGRDGFADATLAELAAAGVDLSHVSRVDAPTGAAFIAVDAAGENQIIVASGANAAVKAAALDALSPAPRDILMMQWEVPEAEILAAARWGRDRGLRIMLNRAPAGPISAELADLLDMVVVNEHEVLALGAGLGVTGEPDAVAAVLSERHGLAVAVTLGAKAPSAGPTASATNPPPIPSRWSTRPRLATRSVARSRAPSTAAAATRPRWNSPPPPARSPAPPSAPSPASPIGPPSKRRPRSSPTSAIPTTGD